MRLFKVSFYQKREMFIEAECAIDAHCMAPDDVIEVEVEEVDYHEHKKQTKIPA